MLSIVNADTIPIYIKEVWLSVYNTNDMPNADVEFGIYRITGHSGGTSVPISSHDTGDAVPVGVSVRTVGTVSGESTIPLETSYWASNDAQISTYGIYEHALSAHMPFWGQTPGTKAIVLRQNEGIHLRCVGAATGANFIVRIIFTT
jgi:hypothetical protein